MSDTTTPWRGRASPRALAEGDFERAADRLGCEVAAIKAVWEVEAAGAHFLPDGSVIRRFEPHHFPSPHWPALGFAAGFANSRTVITEIPGHSFR